jgi:hypothetical protein
MAGGSRARLQLLCGLAILAALGGVLALARGSSAGDARETAPGDGASGALTQREVTRISIGVLPGVARRVARLRGLPFDRLPRPEVVSADYLNGLGLRELRRHRGELGLGADEAVARITGIVAADEQLEAAYRSTGDLAAAAYDTKTERLYVVRDAVAVNRALIEFLLSHELDHALEDQRFGLPEGARLDDDGALARQALVEGLATNVMVEYAARYLNPLSLIAATSQIDTGTGDVPTAFVDQLTWTYLGGNRFISSLRELAGGWKLVDYTLDSRPPATTEQVLHPRKYVRDEEPAAVRIDRAELRRRGWRLADRSVLGELATRQLLELGAAPAAARRAAAGWDGDRYELWRRATAPAGCAPPCRADLALVVVWRWDEATDAPEFARAAGDYLGDGLGGELGPDATWRLDGGYAALRSSARRSAIAFAPDRESAAAAAAANAG